MQFLEQAQFQRNALEANIQHLIEHIHNGIVELLAKPDLITQLKYLGQHMIGRYG